MKNYIFFLIILIVITSCKKSKNISFCEGISTEGEGVNCGTKFDTGELTAIIKSENQFTDKNIFFYIYEDHNSKLEKIDSVRVDVKPEQETANTTLSFYQSGKFKVEAFEKNEKIGEGDIEIVEQ